MNPSKLFPELVVSFLSFGFFIATVVQPVANDVTRSKILIPLLIIISILSGAAGFTRYLTYRTIERLCAVYGEDDEQKLDAELQSVNDHSAGDSNSDHLSSENITNGDAHAHVYDHDHDHAHDHADGTVNRLMQWSDIVKSFLQPSQTTFLLLHGPAAILLLYLTVRLFAVNNFRTQPTNLDFGPKYGRVESDGSYENNIAFTPDFDSAGHFVQGFLAALLSFPAVSGWIARKIASIGMGGMVHFGRARLVLSFITLAYSILTLYPTYNMIKRIHKERPAFASTSYVNNGMEWAMGYTLGLALGMHLTSLMRWLLTVFYPMRHHEGLEAFMHTFDTSRSSVASHQLLNDSEGCEEEDSESVMTPHAGSCRHVNDTSDGSRENTKYAFGKLEEYIPNTAESGICSTSCRTILYNIYYVDCFDIISILSNCILAIFSITVLLSGIYMGITWNKCSERDGDQCINSMTNGVDKGQGMTVIFVLSFLVIQIAFIAILVHR